MGKVDQEAMWSARYRGAGEDYVFGTAPNRFLTRHTGAVCGAGNVLSVADGEGRNSVWLAEQGFTVTATEISPVALEKARRLAASRHVEVEFVLADVVNWTYPEVVFDGVVGVFIQFMAGEDRDRVFASMKMALKPGGVILLQGYTPKQLEYRTGGPSAIENLYTAEFLRDAFADMEIEHLQEYEDELDEGAGHSGRSALVGMIARKPVRGLAVAPGQATSGASS